MSTELYLWSTNVDYHHCWWHRAFLRQRAQTTVADGQIFSGKVSEFQTAKVTLKVILKVKINGAIK